MTLIITFSKKKIGKKNFTLDPRHGTLALNMEPSTLDPRQKDKFLKIYASWPHVFDRCVIFAYIIKGRDSENNGFLPGVSLPPSLPPRAPLFSRSQNPLSLPFQTPATQAKKTITV